MSSTFATPTTTAIPRDRWGRPMIIPVGGGKPVAYTRCTTYVGALEDTYNLGRWQQRMVALGLAARPDLVLSTVAHAAEKDALNEICEKAVEAAKAGAAAVVGTALHSLTDQLDRGTLDLSTVPEAYRADLTAYQDATKPLTVKGIERFVVNDELQVAGTFDREYGWDARGLSVLGDTKTGSIEYGLGKIEMQLSLYSRSQLYDPATGERSPLNVEQDRALVVHLPAGTGKCELLWVDIAAGWEGVLLARHVRAWRARKHLTEPFARNDFPRDGLLDEIYAAPDLDELHAIWAAHKDNWYPHRQLAAVRRKNEINDMTRRGNR